LLFIYKKNDSAVNFGSREANNRKEYTLILKIIQTGDE